MKENGLGPPAPFDMVAELPTGAMMLPFFFAAMAGAAHVLQMKEEHLAKERLGFLSNPIVYKEKQSSLGSWSANSTQEFLADVGNVGSSPAAGIEGFSRSGMKMGASPIAELQDKWTEKVSPVVHKLAERSEAADGGGLSYFIMENITKQDDGLACYLEKYVKKEFTGCLVNYEVQYEMEQIGGGCSYFTKENDIKQIDGGCLNFARKMRRTGAMVMRVFRTSSLSMTSMAGMGNGNRAFGRLKRPTRRVSPRR